MNTNVKPKRQVIFGVEGSPSDIVKARASRTTDGEFIPITDPKSPIVGLVVSMKKVQSNTPETEAKLNKDSMSDNKGGRITFNEDLAGSKVIRGVEDRSVNSIKKK